MNKQSGQATIMIIDDTPANLGLLQEILEQTGYRVVAFPRGSLALRAAAKQAPDLILLDIKMPEMDGFEVCSRLKQVDVLARIPVIFISALSETQDKLKAFSLGGVDYITKPFQEQEVQARVATHIRMRTLQHELERHNQKLEQMVEEKVREISESQLATIHALSELVESRDVETGGHIKRTRNYCRLLAGEMMQNPRFYSRVDKQFVDNIYQAAPLHDIGKFGIPDSILLKPGKLSKNEFEKMKSHVIIGEKTLVKAREKYPGNTFLNMGIDIARSHHEKWDGSGYPDQLSKGDIPLSARIMALADVYDALRSSRPYKKPFSHEESVKIIQQGSGSHFDPDLVDIFLNIHEKFRIIHDRYQ
ncbi:MAG: response regulator [Desulfonatronovibrionaceae bacterium]